MRLSDKSAIITGAGSGIGLAMARQFAAEGASVLAVDWNKERLDGAVADITLNGGRIIGVEGDVSDQTTAAGLIDHALEAFGRLDILVNNAGVMDHLAGVGEVTDEIWRRVFSIDLDAVMYTMRRAVPHMLSKGSGSIINVSSVAGAGGGSAGAAYTAAKHAVIGLTRNTAWMYAKRGIRCNAICPGATNTNIWETMPPDRLDRVGEARSSEYTALSPTLLEPTQTAALAVFLASDEASALNGAIIPADAGWTSA